MGAGGGEGGAAFALRWQVPVCALVFVVPAAAAAVVLCRRSGDHLGAADLWLPCWRRVRPEWLLSYRAAVCVTMSYILCRIIVRRGSSVIYFYTQWTFSLVIVYFLLGTVISAYGCWILSTQATTSAEGYKLLKTDSDLEENEAAETDLAIGDTTKLQCCQGLEVNEQIAGFWGHAMQAVYQTSAGAVVLTDIVFWGLIVPFLKDEHFSLSLLEGFIHSLNLVFLLLDTAFNSLPFPWFRMAYFVLWSSVYVSFHWIIHACGFSWWPYSFLELSTPWAPLWYLCLGLVHIPCYALYALLVRGKTSLFSRWFPDAYVRPH